MTSSQLRGFRSVVGALAVLLVTGCATAPVTIPPDERPEPLPAPLAEFAPASPESASETDVVVEHGRTSSAYGCSLDYEYYTPARSPERGHDVPEPLIVLGHGFMRDLTTMQGWARAWASRGFRTAIVSFCNSSWFAGRHERNAGDLVTIADYLEPGDVPILYGGFSAGGLSALLAAAQDSRSIAYLGLDPVDSGELAATVSRLRLPALFLFGAPDACNAENNMIPVTPEASLLVSLRIPYASHCDFENPYDQTCARVCGSVEPITDAHEIRRTIRALATAWVEAQLGASPEAQRTFHRRTLEALEETHRIEIIAIE